MSGITRLGALTLGAAAPVLPLSLAQLTALLAPIAAQITQLQTTLATPIVLPDVAGYIAALEAAIANVLATLANLPTASIGLHADLSAQIGILLGLALAAQLVIDTLTAAVSTGGIFGYAYEGPPGSLGGDLQASFSGDFPGPGTTRALVLATADPAAWAAMSAVFRTT